ncbi:uncharacterized protein EV422DRAFT_210439 [Fimicolochytrium jonesii]|uniref:uncharacterized protein n=1 Tax=Fimicolochytrium jonesii TaxID=1396493 RepID=UPI0022FE6CDA|nr:uncharacterized protein EV422DRAFT_210439 [Fimicolochytrium jonesii]KAI8817647.1 hypothetical protein EV422DRAFT_210439 [Fimicolochytrium jonesii]
MVWKSAKDRFDANTEALERALQESGLRESNQRKEMEDVLRIKSDITRRLQMREAEVKRLEEEHRVKDAAADEQRVMLSEKINLLEQSMNRRDDDVQKLKSAMHRQQRDDQKEIRALREALEESQRDLSEMISRNKQSSADLEESVSTCAKLSHQIGELSNTHREDQADIRELSQKCATQLEELERLLASETYLKRELAASEHRLSQMAEEKVRAETQLVSSQRTANALQLDLDKWRLKAEDLKGAHDQLKIAHERLVQSEGSLKSERNDLLSIRDRQTRDIEAAASERKHLIDKISELQRAVDKEASLHADVKAQSKERLMDLAEKFRSLQKNLDEAQVEVDKFRGAERILRTALRDKEDSAHKYALRVKELETTVRNQQHQLALDHQKVDDIKIRKKEELLAVNDKFSAAKSAMDAQAADLRTRLQAKSAKIADLDNHLSRAKIELSEATAERLRLEARIYELTVTSESRQHELVSLQSSLAEKEREIASLHSQMASVRESAEQSQKQLKALKGAEIEKVTGKVSELNKKLAAKVDELLQSGARRDHRVSDRSDSPTPTTSPQQRMYKKHSEAPDIKSLLFDSHTKRTHVDEPPKITTTSRRWFDEPTRLRSSSRSRSSSPSRAQQHRRSGDDIRSDSVTRLEGDVEKMNQRLQDQVKALLAKKSAAGSSAPRSEQPARNQSHYGGDASTRAGKGKSTTFYDDETSQSHENVLSSSTNASSAAAAFPTIHISAPTGPLFAGARHAGGSSHRVNDTTSTSTSASLPAHRHQQQRRPVDGSGDSLAVFQSALDIQAGDDGNNDSDGNVFDRMGSLKDLGSTYHFGEDDGDFGNTHPLSARKDEQEGLFATSPLVRPSADDGMAW